MASLNKVQIIGNLTRDVELKYTPKGTAVGELGIAVNRKWKTDSGEKREEVTYVDICCFGKTAEIASEYLKKGSSVYIEGRLQLETWDDKQSGQKRSKLKVVCEGMQFLGSKPQGQQEPRREQPQRREEPRGKPQQRQRQHDADLDVEGDQCPV